MTGPRPSWRWDPFRPIDMLAALWSSAAVTPVSTGAAAGYRTLFTTVRRLVLGRRLTVTLDEGDLTLTVTTFDARLDLRALSVGQLGDVRLKARDIRWNDTPLDRASAVLRNVHLRPTAPPVLVAAPVELTVDVPATAVERLVGWAQPRLLGEIGTDGVARLRLAGRPSWGQLEVDVGMGGSTLWLRPRAVILRRTRMGLPRRTPAYPVRMPELPHGLEVTALALGPGRVEVTGTVPQWRLDIPRKRLEDILGQLGAVGRPLNLSRFPLGR